MSQPHHGHEVVLSAPARCCDKRARFLACCRTPTSIEAHLNEVILLQKVPPRNIGDRVKVKSGFGLIPAAQGKATVATPDNVKRFEARVLSSRSCSRALVFRRGACHALKEFNSSSPQRPEPRASSSAHCTRYRGTLPSGHQDRAQRSSSAERRLATIGTTQSFCICTPISMCRWQ